MLLIRPHPKATDTLPNYLQRLIAANHYKNPMQLLRSANCKISNNRLPSKSIFFGDFDLERLAILANINLSQVEGLKFKRINNTRCLAFGKSFLTKSINFSLVRVCPFCHEELKTIPFINSLSAKTYCAKHNFPLISANPSTGDRLTWGTPYLWRDASSWHDKRPNHEVNEVEFKINKHIELLEASHLIIGGLSINLAEYCDLLDFFAHFHQFSLGTKYNINSKYDIEFSRQYYSAAHWYVTEWPTPFFELLAHFEVNPMSDKRLTGIRKCFRDLYDEIYSPENSYSGAYKLLKSGFEEYLRDHFSTGMLMQSLSQIDPQVKEQSTFISETQVAELLCCHLSKVKVYVREKLISSHHSLVNGTRLFLRADIIKLKTRLRNCCSIDECAQLLGISVYHTRQLLRVEIICPLIKPNSESRDWLIERLEVKKLINRLKASVDVSIKKSITAKKRYTFAKVDFSRLIQSMLEKSINYGYTANKKQPLSLEQFTPSFDANDKPLNDFLSPTEAKIELGVNINAIYDFIKLGYLECNKLQVKRTARPIKMIPKASINKFKSRYLLTRNTKNMHPNDIYLTSGPMVDGCCVNLYCKV